MTESVPIDMTDITVTPVFKIIEIEDIPASENAGRLVKKTMEVVEVRFAGQKNYMPVFPADAFWQREGNRVITYAERWPDQYRAFKEGSPQEALGTPLDLLADQGITPELISLCRALRIYSIEALHHLEGQALKSLGMNANRLKEAAAAHMADRMGARAALDEVDALRKRIAELEAAGARSVPLEAPTEAEVDVLVAEADAHAGKTDDELKEEIAVLAGRKPPGNPSRETLVRTLEELQAA